MGIQIGKAIHHILSNDSAVSAEVGTKIFPLVATLGTTYPFIIYKRTSDFPLTTKDRYVYQESDIVLIYIVTDTYNKSIEIADKVRDALEYKEGTFAGINIKSSEMTNADEEYIEDAFVLNLTFKFLII